MDTNTIKNLFDRITLWKKGGQRAPHKPLLILYALGQCLQNKKQFISYSEIDIKLKELLVEFGPARKSYHPEYPFWRLQNDGLWELQNAESVTSRKGNTDAKKTELIKFDVHGGFKKEIYDFLISNQDQIPEISFSILENNFPNSIHEDILQSVGLSLEFKKYKRARDPYFRDKVLNAYEYQCAVCGFNVRVGNSLVGLEAAHIKWHQAGGPDNEENGVALCSLHHKLFDRGAFTLSNETIILISDRAHGTGGFKEWLMNYHEKKLRKPQRPSFHPSAQYISWHNREVFQGDGRHKVV